jgi:hypothetical protein
VRIPSGRGATIPRGRRSPPPTVLSARSIASALLAPYALLLTADYRFVFGDPELEAQYPNGFSREDEIASADHLFHGFVNAAGVYRPRAQTIQVDLGELAVATDPEKPESTASYQVVTSPAVHLLLTFPNGQRMEVTHAAHEFHVVRGEAAVLSAGQIADEDHWYVRRWIEKGDAISAVKPDSATALRAAAAPLTPPAPPRVLAVLQHPNPAVWPLAIELSIPGRATAEVGIVDVAGRMVARRQLAASEPGTRRVDFGAGVKLTPGVYWIRAVQGNRIASSRLVVIR